MQIFKLLIKRNLHLNQRFKYLLIKPLKVMQMFLARRPLKLQNFRLFLPLLKEDDEILTDIGFERTDIQWALNLPLKIDALKALEACRRARVCSNVK